MTVVPPSPVENSRFPSPPDPKRQVHPLVALSLAISAALGAGLLAGWEAAVTVLCAVLGFFGSANPPTLE